jgi:hypothetical protein
MASSVDQVGNGSNVTPTVYGISVMLLLLNLAVVGLRFWVRKTMHGRWKADDYISAVALFFAFGYFGSVMAGKNSATQTGHPETH